MLRSRPAQLPNRSWRRLTDPQGGPLCLSPARENGRQRDKKQQSRIGASARYRHADKPSQSTGARAIVKRSHLAIDLAGSGSTDAARKFHDEGSHPQRPHEPDLSDDGNDPARGPGATKADPQRPGIEEGLQAREIPMGTPSSGGGRLFVEYDRFQQFLEWSELPVVV